MIIKMMENSKIPISPDPPMPPTPRTTENSLPTSLPKPVSDSFKAIDNEK